MGDKDNKRMSSIARRMGRSWTRRLFFVFLWLNLFIAAFAIGGYCYTLEVEQLGNFDIERPRGLIVDATGSVEQIVDTAEYRVEDAQGQMLSFGLSTFIRATAPLMCGLLIVELLILLSQSGAGRRSANRLLKPLTQMAKSAQKLSTATFDEARFETLEHAIEEIKPDNPMAKLSIRDRELKGLEGAINDMLERTHASYREQLRFVSDASHELRTPIAVIQGYSSMLERWGKQDEAILDESIQAIKSEAEHMNKLVEQLLFLARSDSGRTELSVTPVNLTALIEEVYEEYRMIDPSHEYLFQPDMRVMCMMDEGLIKQVSRILTDNARRYTPEGGVITLRVLDGERPGFQVQDSGIGIAEGDLPHIFERFYRSDPARTRASGGTGLGLSIAKWIVDRHGGYFEVMSRQGLGTRITVRLPLVPLSEESES